MEKLTAIVSIILALSIASERLVEIIKGLFRFLDTPTPDNPRNEGMRRSALQLLAVVAGVATAFMARDYVPIDIAGPTTSWKILALGLLASGGSGLWNSILTYMGLAKDLKKAEFKREAKAP